MAAAHPPTGHLHFSRAMFVPLVGLLMGRSAGRGGRGGSKRGVNGANSCRAGWSCDGSGPRIIVLFIGIIGLLHWGKFLVESVTSPIAMNRGHNQH